MYRVLKGEMVKSGISTQELAQEIGISERTLRSKISEKTGLLLSEAKKIRSIVSPNLTLDELFANEKSSI